MVRHAMYKSVYRPIRVVTDLVADSETGPHLLEDNVTTWNILSTGSKVSRCRDDQTRRITFKGREITMVPGMLARALSSGGER